jgi:(p)ppGpp synthase/HD superfamily hydrolase
VHRELADIPGADAALAFLTEAYRTRLRRSGRTVEHPIGVATLLAEEGQSTPVVIAGILHDVLEDTDARRGELDETFGADVTRLVSALTQDPSIKKYRKRKTALRQRILDAGPEAAAVSLADKAAKLRSAQTRPAERKLEHYHQTLRGIERRYGSSHLSALLREQLDRWPEQ